LSQAHAGQGEAYPDWVLETMKELGLVAECEVCGRDMVQRRATKKICSDKCRAKAYRDRKKLKVQKDSVTD
jgi:hypothetical protein